MHIFATRSWVAGIWGAPPPIALLLDWRKDILREHLRDAPVPDPASIISYFGERFCFIRLICFARALIRKMFKIQMDWVSGRWCWVSFYGGFLRAFLKVVYCFGCMVTFCSAQSLANK